MEREISNGIGQGRTRPNTYTKEESMRSLVALLALVLLVASATAETFTWTTPRYVVKDGEGCGGIVDSTKLIAPEYCAGLTLEIRQLPGGWSIMQEYAAWLPGTVMSYTTSDPLEPGTYEIRFNSRLWRKFCDGPVGGPYVCHPDTLMSTECPSDIRAYTVNQTTIDSCPPEKSAAPTVLP